MALLSPAVLCKKCGLLQDALSCLMWSCQGGSWMGCISHTAAQKAGSADSSRNIFACLFNFYYSLIMSCLVCSVRKHWHR